LNCPSQKYAWGKVGKDSLVGQLAEREPENIPYAELWMGTHPSGPAKVGDISLSDYLKSSKEDRLGIPNYHSELPFLLKVLSVQTALSIQAHPDITLAKQLNKNDPINYKDANHKPELCIALGRFEAFCGFQKMEEISDHLSKYNILRDLVGESIATSFQSSLTKENITTHRQPYWRVWLFD
jgi:mannose-6-phosphate isomerase